MKKILIILLFIIYPFSTFAVVNDELFSIYFNNYINWGTVYSLPPWKDLIITELVSEENAGVLSIRDNGGDTLAVFTWDMNYKTSILIKNTLDVQKTSTPSKWFTVIWFLINEWENINEYLWIDSWINKDIFTQQQILEFYVYELAFLIIIANFYFFINLIGKRSKYKLF